MRERERNAYRGTSYLLDHKHRVALHDDLLGAELGGGAKPKDDALVLGLVVGLALTEVLVPAANTILAKYEYNIRTKLAQK